MKVRRWSCWEDGDGFQQQRSLESPLLQRSEDIWLDIQEVTVVNWSDNGVWGGGTRGQEKTHLRLAVKHRSSFLCPMCVPKIAPWRQIFYSLPRWLDTRSSSGYSRGISCHDWGDSLTEKTCLDWPGQDSGGKHRFFFKKKAILLLILWEFQTIFSDRISHITPDLSQIYLCLPTPANFWSSFYLGIT